MSHEKEESWRVEDDMSLIQFMREVLFSIEANISYYYCLKCKLLIYRTLFKSLLPLIDLSSNDKLPWCIHYWHLLLQWDQLKCFPKSWRRTHQAVYLYVPCRFPSLMMMSSWVHMICCFDWDHACLEMDIYSPWNPPQYQPGFPCIDLSEPLPQLRHTFWSLDQLASSSEQLLLPTPWKMPLCM